MIKLELKGASIGFEQQAFKREDTVYGNASIDKMEKEKPHISRAILVYLRNSYLSI